MRKIGITDNPLAQQVQREFERLMGEGLSSFAAAERILAQHAERIHDPDDGPDILFALASLQLDACGLTPLIRKRALTLINSGEALERWKNESPEVLEARRAEEQRLRQRLVEYAL